MSISIGKRDYSAGAQLTAPVKPRQHRSRVQAARGRREFLALLIAVLLVSSGLSRRVEAATGDLDPTFDTDGKLTTSFGGPSVAYGIAIQSDGKIVAVGSVVFGNVTDFAVARYQPDGVLDASFGSSGKVTTDFFGDVDEARGVAIQDDGKIIVVGAVGGSTDPNAEFALARYNSNGSLDITFGNGGKVVTDLTGTGDYAHDVVVQSDGKIVVAGTVSFSGINSDPDGTADFGLARYHDDGSLDLTFGSGGMVNTDFFGNTDLLGSDVLLQSDGKIVVAGSAFVYNSDFNSDFALARYYSDGALDATFGSGGKITTDFYPGSFDRGFGFALQSDGKIVAAGGVSSDGLQIHFALARYNTEGGLDASFGNGGKVNVGFSESWEIANGVAIQSDGKVVAGGFLGLSNSDFGLARYDSNGILDVTFGNGGYVNTDFAGEDDFSGAVVIQSDCRILLAGKATQGGVAHFALARYDGGPCGAAAACPQPQGYWKNNPDAWQVDSLTLGNRLYGKAELLAILNTSTQKDASLILARQLITAKLNIANGTDPVPVSGIIADADGLLGSIDGKLPYKIKPSLLLGQAMISCAGVLDTYNKGQLTPGCAP